MQDYPALALKTDYTEAQSVGARIHREGHPGLVVPSVRYFGGQNNAVFNPVASSNSRFNCQLTYRLDGQRIVVERQPGVLWMEIPITEI
jgi:hypothetical protein